MELGGHAPFIVFDDADPVHAAEGRGRGEVPQHRPGVHLPEPHVRAARHRRASSSPRSSSASQALQAGSGLDRRRHHRPADRRGRAMTKMERQVADALDKGARLVTGGERLTDDGLDGGCFYAPTAARRRHARHAHLPRGDLRPDRAGHRVRRRRRGHRDGQRHRLRPGVVRLHERPRRAPSGSSRRCDFGIVGVNDINPTSAAAPFGGMKQSGLGARAAREGIDEYLDTKLVGITL